MSLTYIRNLKLADIAPVFESRSLTDTATETIALPEGAPSASIAGGSLVSFVAGLSADAKDDVLDSIQLAQRAADKAHDRFQNPRQWFETVVDVLSNTGWTITASNWTTHDLKEGEYQVAKSAISALASVATGPQTLILKVALTALESLSNEDGYITLFEHYGVKNTLGSFLVSAAEQIANGTIELSLGSFEMRATEAKHKMLFFKWSEHQVAFWAAVQKAAFNPKDFAPLRDDVRAMLGSGRKNYLKQIKL